MLKKLVSLILGLGIVLTGFSLKAQLPDYQLVPESLVKNFQKGLQELSVGQYDSGFTSLDEALKEFWRFQIQDLPAYSISLVRFLQRGEVSEEIAQRVLEYSDYFSPYSSEVCLARAGFYLSPGHFSLRGAFSEFQKAYQVLQYDLIMRLRVKAWIFLGVLQLLGLSLLIISGIILIRYFRVLLHWVNHLLPEPYQKPGWLILVLVFLMPVFLGVRLWLILVLPAIFCAVFAPREIKAIFLFLIFSYGFAGFLEEKSRDLMIPLKPGALLSQLHLRQGLADGKDLAILRSSAESSSSPLLILSLAETERRAGNYKTSSELLITLLENPEFSAIAYHQLALLYLEFNELKAALKALEKAEPELNNSVEVYYNLSQVYNALHQYQLGEEFYKKANQINAKAVSRFELGRKLTGINILPVPIMVPAVFLEKEIVPARNPSLIISTGKYQFSLFILSLILLLIPALKNKGGVCNYCGKIICPRCLAQSREAEICAPCYSAFVSGKAMDPKLKVEQKNLVKRYHRWMAGMGIILNLFLPGSGLILEEKTISGLVFLIYPIIFLSVLMLRHLGPPMLVPGGSLWSSVLVLGGIGYLLMSVFSILVYLRLTRIEV